MTEHNMTAQQQGIALIQILLITAILTVFAMYVTQTARQQIQVATWAQDRAEAEVALHSAEAEMLFTLLTENKFILSSDTNNQSVNLITKNWNFHNQNFRFNSIVDIAVQDQAGLINLHYLHLGRFQDLLIKNGVSEQRARQIGDHLYDWQDADSIPRANGAEQVSSETTIRNGKIPDITEIEHIINLSDYEKKLIYDNTGIFYVGDFNPITASQELIRAESNQAAAEQVNALRAKGVLSVTQFKEITGITETNDMRYFPSNFLGITYTATVNQSVLTREIVISLAPYAKNGFRPFNILLDRS